MPRQRNDNGTAIHEVDRHGVLREVNVFHLLARLRFRSVHSISPGKPFHFPLTSYPNSAEPPGRSVWLSG